MPTFTDVYLRNLALPTKGQITLVDESSPLRLRVSQGGSKTFFVTLDGSGTRHVIGRYGEVSLKDAREAARKLRAEKTLGRIIPAAVDLTRAREEYLKQADIRQSTREYYERNLNRLKGSKLSDITPRDITRILGTLSASSRLQCLRTYTAFFNWCLSQHYLDRSPCERMEGGKSRRRERVLSTWELQAIWEATSDPSNYHSIIRLLIVTGQRKTEWAHCQHSWIDDYGVRIPGAIAKNHNGHHFPLGSLSRSLIPKKKGLLFPSEEGTPYSAWSKSKIELDSALNIEPWQLRDLRRTYRTLHASIGTTREIAERLVNHISEQGELEKVYDRFDYAEPMQQAQTRFEAHLSKLLKLG